MSGTKHRLFKRLKDLENLKASIDRVLGRSSLNPHAAPWMLMRNGLDGHPGGAGVGAGGDEYLGFVLAGSVSAGCGGSLCELCRQTTLANEWACPETVLV